MRLPRRKILATILLALLGFAGWAALRANVPVTAFRREITVDVPRQVAWDHLARVRAWPSWAKSITSVEIAPGDVVGPTTVAALGTGSMTTTFRMAEFDPPNHWMWTSRILWFTLLYDHVFEPVSDSQTKLILHMRVSGFGKILFARVVDAMSKSDHDVSLPLLVKEMNSLKD